MESLANSKVSEDKTQSEKICNRNYQHCPFCRESNVNQDLDSHNCEEYQMALSEKTCSLCHASVEEGLMKAHFEVDCKITKFFRLNDKTIENDLFLSILETPASLDQEKLQSEQDQMSSKNKEIEESVSYQKNLENVTITHKCMSCKEMVNKNEWNKHNELCIEASKYVEELMCLICDFEFDTLVESIDHVKKEHLDLIGVKEKPCEIVPQAIDKTKVKTEIKKEIFDSMNSNDFDVNLDIQEKMTNFSDLNVNMNGQDNQEPLEITTLFKCSMCFKKYLSSYDVETHISSFHRIPIEVQKKGGISTAIIKEIL